MSSPLNRARAIQTFILVLASLLTVGSLYQTAADSNNVDSTELVVTYAISFVPVFLELLIWLAMRKEQNLRSVSSFIKFLVFVYAGLLVLAIINPLFWLLGVYFLMIITAFILLVVLRITQIRALKEETHKSIAQ